jgi:exonuclease III
MYCKCDIIVVNVHAPSECKHDDSKDNFCEKLEGVFDHLLNYDKKILLGDFDAKLGRKDSHPGHFTSGNEIWCPLNRRQFLIV